MSLELKKRAYTWYMER